ncbi:MAG: AAA family ATPase [Actinobacteria bacterium]|nr:AAA family ATPase [Actinomycetota bacterium]
MPPMPRHPIPMVPPMTDHEYEAFDLAGPLPTGITLLQASAGTGKTFALAALAVRSIAELGLSASELCVVTFTEAATSELRGRIRERIAEAIAHLEATAHLDPDVAITTDPVLIALGRGTDGQPIESAEHLLRLARLRTALDEFDTATISTIHGFCSRVLAIAGGASADTPISSDTDHIVELINDLFVSRFSGSTPAPVTPAQLLRAVETRLKLPDARLYRWNVDDPGPNAGARVRNEFTRSGKIAVVADLVDEVVELVLQQRTDQRRRTYDSLITDARAHIVSSDGVGTVASLRARFSLVMIDEFQDTDQVQWSMFRTAFLDSNSQGISSPVTSSPVTTVLVGDPKQSIYRFRSAELSAYLGALEYARTNGRVFSLRVNWRSDRAVLDGLDHLFGGLAFGDPRIVFESVDAAPDHDVSPFAIAGAPATAAVELRTIGVSGAPAARTVAFADLVAEIIRLLNTATIERDGIAQPLRPSDIGVLVRSNADASRCARALNEAGVPAASSSADSVLGSTAARHWRWLADALARPSSASLVRTAATTWFIGLDGPSIAALTDERLSELIEQVRGWATDLTEGGLPRLMASLRAGGLAGRVLAAPSGERDLTDLEHIAELLQSATSGRPISPAALSDLLTGMSAGAGDTEAESTELLGRRIDRDDDTVKVLTLHKAKGLEFPVVLCPTLWAAPSGSRGSLKHGEVGGQRLIEICKLASNAEPLKGYKDVVAADKQETDGEELRLIYVALTRARHRLVVWWNPPASGQPPLATVLGAAIGTDAKNVEVAALVAASNGTISEVAAVSGPPPALARAAVPTPTLEVASISRNLRDDWRIWSFTAINSASGDHASPSAPGAAVWQVQPEAAPLLGGADEFAGDDPETLDPATPALTPLQSAPAGPAFGTLVHSALERVDFTSGELDAELTSACAALMNHRPLAIAPAALASGLINALQAPLGGPLGSTSLVEVTQVDRRNELDFDLPLAAFDASKIASVMLDHLPSTDPLHPWFVEAAAGALDVSLDGMLTGSIDLVARTVIGDQPCFWIADYKTNLIRTGDYSGPALATAMHHSGYALQATIYLVALHRFLRWRLGAAYEPQSQLLGAAYLFLRGMDPANDSADPAGVHWFQPPLAAIEALDLLFATGAAS